MAVRQEPNLGIHYNWDSGQSGWDVQLNANLLALGTFALMAVQSATTESPPADPDDGERYLVPPTTASAIWNGFENQILVWDDDTSDWLAYTPKETWNILALDTGQRHVYNGSAWVLDGSLLGEYATDTAASAAGVLIGGKYINSSTGAVTVRRT